MDIVTTPCLARCPRRKRRAVDADCAPWICFVRHGPRKINRENSTNIGWPFARQRCGLERHASCPRKVAYKESDIRQSDPNRLLLHPPHREYQRRLPCGYLEALPITFWCVELTGFSTFVSSTRIACVVACRLL